MNGDFSVVEIRNLQDDLLLHWLDLYETTFPTHEKMLISTFLKLLSRKVTGEADDEFMLAAVNQQRELTGIAQYELHPGLRLAFLGYLAVQPLTRGRGIGSHFYREILARIDSNLYRALIVEVEIPEDCTSEEKRQSARRRIEFYRRNGARLLGGIHYLQFVGSHQPPTPMHVLVHPLQRLTPETAFELVKLVAKEALTQTGPLTLA
jgi:ribosomal protein S18 acetylase RimI-like enzyme